MAQLRLGQHHSCFRCWASHDEAIVSANPTRDYHPPLSAEVVIALAGLASSAFTGSPLNPLYYITEGDKVSAAGGGGSPASSSGCRSPAFNPNTSLRLLPVSVRARTMALSLSPSPNCP